ncbi:hypothetical protein ABPG72_005842 [Tetrahymena utriculariae]
MYIETHLGCQIAVNRSSILQKEPSQNKQITNKKQISIKCEQSNEAALPLCTSTVIQIMQQQKNGKEQSGNSLVNQWQKKLRLVKGTSQQTQFLFNQNDDHLLPLFFVNTPHKQRKKREQQRLAINLQTEGL